jgi:hypothetical protein
MIIKLGENCTVRLSDISGVNKIDNHLSRVFISGTSLTVTSTQGTAIKRLLEKDADIIRI